MSSNWIERKRRTFGYRLNAWFTSVLVAMAAGLFFATYFLLTRSIAAQDREVIQAQLEVYRAWYQDGGLGELSEHFAQRDDSGKESFFVRITGPESSALFISLPKQSDPVDLAALDKPDDGKPIAWLQTPASDQHTRWLIATVRLADGDHLQVGKTTEAQTALLDHFRFVFGWVVLIAIVLGLAGGSWLTGRALAPIRQLIAALQQAITTGNFDRKLPVRVGTDELSQLAGLFDQMLEKNAGLIRGMREALDNVAHDLRTPLARLRATAETALQSPGDPDAAREALSDSLEESDRVLTILDTLMDISEAEVGLMRLDKSTLNLAELVNAVIDLYQFVAENKSISVTASVPADLTCLADANRLRQVLVNLLDNALKYGSEGGHVRFTARRESGEVVIEVEDDGTGISAEDLPRIWERLYRGDKSRTHRGLGLGLSLVKAVVGAHAGTMMVHSTLGEGSTFRVGLPG
jgi:signal transduction histidine kinase